MSGPEVTALLERCVTRLGGAQRDGQQEMAAAVHQTLTEEAVLLVQAGTGTGKSLAYLVPTLDHAVRSGRRTIISTATLALQRQLISSDVPLVSDVVAAEGPRAPQVALLKGWHNYVCKHKVAGGYPAEDDAGLFAADAATPDPVGSAHGAAGAPTAAGVGPGTLGSDVQRLREWAQHTDTGDRDDLDPGVGDRSWRQVSVTRLECLGARCPMLEECFAEQARRTAHEADVVITNHAMLGIAAAGSTRVLPEHDVLVVDEAHELVDRVTAQGTLELSVGAVDRTARLVGREGIAISALEEAATVLRSRLADVPTGRLRRLPAELHDVIRGLGEGCREALAALRGERQGEPGAKEMTRSALQVLQDICGRLLDDGLAQRRDVLWCERGRDGDQPPRLHLAPLDVARAIGEHLLTDRSVVLTSATLALGGGFEQAARATGAAFLPGGEGATDSPGWRGLDVGSPFDYPRQGILYVAGHLPPPGQDGPSEQAQRELVELVRAAGGATLGLFTSHRAAQQAAALLRAELDTPVLCQGDEHLPALVRRFVAEPATTLLGTLSLWQGLDVPGPACRLVVIDRIPFPRPDDPLRQARSEVVAAGGGNGFMQVAAAHAALLLAQGAGRLVRTTTDRGVVAVLDPRLATARYRTFLLRSMPPLWPTTDTATATAALRRLAATTSTDAAATPGTDRTTGPPAVGERN